MFKRIAKITGFVLLGFVLLVGGVVGFMAIRGDFKKKVVKPTAIDFSISKTDLTFDASLKNNQTVDNEQIFSFTISAEPLDVTETKCKIEVNYSNLITFVEWKDGQWIDYNSNQFHLNAPIFFKLNDITDENLEDYQDGILTITVIDESGLLRDTLDLAIDRNVTSISFKDRGINENNTITNGLFVYEGGKYYGEVNQTLEAIEGEDYPLEVITAPHKASKPFDSKTEKIHEIYFIEDGQPRLINYNTEDKIVELLRYDDHGNMVAETCNFLKFDTENKYFVFNSQQSGEYEFKLATYPTYAIQEEMLSQDMSFIERLQSREENDTPTMLTKTVIITVNGTEAEEITFEGDEEKITMGLLQDNKWVANDNTVLDMYNLGLTLSKATSQTEILGRYNELKFLSSDNFIDKLTWTFKQAVLNGENYTYGKDDIIVNFYTNASGNIKARISGLTSENIDNTIEYDVRLEKYYSSYNLTLSYTKYQEDEETIESATTITFALIADEVTGRELRLSGIQKESSVITTVTIYKQVAEMEGETSYLSLYLQSGNCLILGDQILENNQPTGMYKFKTLQAGLYLALLGADGDTELYTLINEKFITNIDYDGASSVITIKPIDGDLIGRDIKLYAIVINSNGTWTYTNTEKSAIVNDKIHSTVNLSNNGQLSLPVTIDENGLDYGKGFDVEDLAWVQEGSSYSELLMFAPRYTMLTQKPAEWDKGLVVYKCTDANAQVYIKTNSKDETWGTTQYYTKNNFKTIDCITITEADITYYLLGVIENGHFVNKVIPTGTNYYSKLYPVLIKSKYIHAQNGLQTAESYVDELLSANYADGVAIFNGGDVGIKYDTTLLPERYITKTASAYVITTGIYNANKQYYIYNIEIGMYELVDTMPQNDIDNWASAKLNYYEKVDYLRAIDVLGLVSTEDTSNINVNLTYYTLNTTTNTLDNPIKYVSGDTDFISNWSSYYIIVSHYIINSAESDGEFITDGNNITIKASVVSGGIRVGAPVEFVISVSDYNAAIKENLDVDYAELYMTSVATANSYYDFRASDIEPTVGFGGSYFDNEQTYNGDIYQIIAGHKEIEFGWEQTTKNPIKDQEAQVFFSVNSNYNTEILQNIMTKLSHDDSIRVLEYDEHDNFVGLVSGKVSITAINNGYICANATYNPSLKYYTFENDSYTLATIDENVDWAKDYNKYYINAIYATFEVTDVIAEGHYIRFEWSYVNDYKILSSKLIILSRNVTGYSIDVGSPVYEAKLLTQETYTGDFYTYDKDANVFTIVDKNETPYNSEGGYYQLLTTEYTGDISYVLEISYNAGYVYNVYIVNTSEDYLYYKEGDALKRKMVNATVAFKLSANGGWIKPEPFYAQNVEYDIESNAYIQFDYDENSNTYNIVNAKITDESKNKGFVNITLQPDEGSVNKTINLKIVDDGKFALRLDAITTKTSSMEFKLSENIYTYNNDSIASQLSVDVTGFAIGQKDSDLYETQYNANAIEIVEIATGTPIVSVECIGNIWTITRKNTFDYITLNVEFAGIGEPVTKVFSFESPYTIVKSQDNTTSVIYSGTTFVIAKDSSVKDLDTLYTFTIATKETALTIEYKLEGISKTYEAIEGSDGKWLFVVPTDVTAPTKATFTIKYGTDVADTFELEVRPNMVLGATDDIQLDDLTNSTYEFVNLNISKYKTVDENSAIIEYTTYASNLEKVTTLSDLEYEYVTFTDEACQNQYSINVVSIDEDENKLKVISPISKVGTYYVKVWIYNVDATIGRIQIGEVKFEITTKSQVVNASNPIIIDAKTNKE
ncbi:MAG: hypothetical protein IJ371_06775, partial [Clostridia bacterium]|nr:hypothetical protein [Clostridia bacterium]